MNRNLKHFEKSLAQALFTFLFITLVPKHLEAQPPRAKVIVGASCKYQMTKAISFLSQTFPALDMLSESVEDRDACLDNMDWVFNLAIDYFGSWDRYRPDAEFCRALGLGFAVERSENCKYRFGIDPKTDETGCRLSITSGTYSTSCPFLDFTIMGSDYSCCLQWNMIQRMVQYIEGIYRLADGLRLGYDYLGCQGQEIELEDTYRTLETFYHFYLTRIQGQYGYSDFSGKCKLVPLEEIIPQKKSSPPLDEAGIQ